MNIEKIYKFWKLQEKLLFEKFHQNKYSTGLEKI